MRDILGDDRFLFFGASSVIISVLWFSDLVLSGFIFWTLAVVWAAILVLALKVKKHVLKADTWPEAEKLGTISRRTAIGAVHPFHFRSFFDPYPHIGSSGIRVLLNRVLRHNWRSIWNRF
jgi:hypothetical protein